MIAFRARDITVHFAGKPGMTGVEVAHAAVQVAHDAAYEDDTNGQLGAGRLLRYWNLDRRAEVAHTVLDPWFELVGAWLNSKKAFTNIGEAPGWYVARILVLEEKVDYPSSSWIYYDCVAEPTPGEGSKE